MSSPTSQGKMGKTCLPQKVGEDGEDMSGTTGEGISETKFYEHTALHKANWLPCCNV